MSLLLDALKRSEREREITLRSRVGQAVPPPRAGRTSLPWLLAVVVLLCINAGFVALWLHQPEPAAPTPRDTSKSLAAPPPRAPKLRSLAHEAALGARRPASTQSNAEQTTQPKAARAGSRQPPTTARPQATGESTPTDTARSTTQPLSHTTPSDLPALHMQIHFYTADRAKRFVMINMRSYGEGDRLTSGPTVMRIRPVGVVLRYQGRNFLLSRE